jgi:RND family efflux transporter MFP subunit
MTRKRKTIIAAVLLAGVAAGWWFLHKPGSSPADGEERKEPAVAQVEVATLKRKTIEEKSTAYGGVIAQAGKSHAVALSFECRVRHVLVTPGQIVAEGDALLEIEPSSAAKLQFAQALNTAEVTARELKQTRERFNQKLAVNQDLNQAEKAARDAAIQLQSLQKQGIDGDNILHANTAGVVAKVDAQNGQLVPAGGSLVETVAEADIEVELGVEPGMIGMLNVNDPVDLFAVNNSNAERVHGKVRLITRQVDPATRLVNVFVTLPPGSKFLLGSYVRGEIPTTDKNALAVPNSALLPADGAYSLFTVRDGKAVRHLVKTGVQNKTETQVLGDEIREGNEVVIIGNYELEDGMAVEIKPETKAAR